MTTLKLRTTSRVSDKNRLAERLYGLTLAYHQVYGLADGSPGPFAAMMEDLAREMTTSGVTLEQATAVMRRNQMRRTPLRVV